MSTTTLRVKHAPGFRVDGSALLPAALAARSSDEVARLVLAAGNVTCTAGDLFDVSRSDGGKDEQATLIIEGDAPWLDRIGAHLAEGQLRVTGATGDYAGLRMTGGALQIGGNAGSFAACEMRGGLLTVAGNAGDFAAAALPGDIEGMTGGTVAIAGHAGARLGDRMRRGSVLVGGDAGDFSASRLVAGTICIAGRIGAHHAYGMRRGTLLLLREPERVPPTFVEGGRGFDVFWQLFVRALAALREPLAATGAASLNAALAPFFTLDSRMMPRRLSGDLAVDGRGELLIAHAASQGAH
ncbi:formylmethanofuran dehydrogenase subunit C [Paraburkholderia sp. SOS3]|jgi:formylmethanofuran dehydrogenase subunit C|uniref:formylmethanofuran dehydrogenase subunit C n=1 Tax=Paraburkholderia sp. SOS3 TaxID=1926494 RepID=UPI0009476015|nr:formylmethanofuran dehydrogenase subunit C [Paraburkholderia sp. SOS3]APR38453.1 formylmethanofuran dehydrogenase subunit C [Paraburkholderia sp. SOS3]